MIYNSKKIVTDGDKEPLEIEAYYSRDIGGGYKDMGDNELLALSRKGDDIKAHQEINRRLSLQKYQDLDNDMKRYANEKFITNQEKTKKTGVGTTDRLLYNLGPTYAAPEEAGVSDRFLNTSGGVYKAPTAEESAYTLPSDKTRVGW